MPAKEKKLFAYYATSKKDRTMYRTHGFVVLRGAASPGLLAQCRKYIAQTDQWSPGDAGTNAWQESTESLPAAIIDNIPVRLVSDIVEKPILEHVEWINVYGVGQFIQEHRDAGGDIQMLICIEAPLPRDGGQLWIGSGSDTVEMYSGDILVFRAAALMHGTTPIKSGQSQRRITLNVRMWTDVMVRRLATS